MNHYKSKKTGKTYTPQQRYSSLQLLKDDIKNGLYTKTNRCNRCGQDKGIIHDHVEDYEKPREREELCWRCHMIHHSQHFAPEQCEAYWETVKAGKVWPPIFKADFSILASEHGIIKPAKKNAHAK